MASYPTRLITAGERLGWFSEVLIVARCYNLGAANLSEKSRLGKVDKKTRNNKEIKGEE